jgi:hypothetical protein
MFDVSSVYKGLLAAYRVCIKNKPKIRRKPFHLHHESILAKVAEQLVQGTWRPGVSTVFVVTRPKSREVVAAQISDRVVHHYLYAWMAPWWERRFSSQSYACRPGKGPRKAGQDLRDFIRHYAYNKGQPLWYLKMDVSHFFPSIDHDVLIGILQRRMERGHYLKLCELIIRHRPLAPGAYRLASPRSQWRHVPPHKSLFHAPPGKGLPIGNLTSQFFANIYMNDLDQFLARELKSLYCYWQRYVDDILLLADDPRKLITARDRMTVMVKDKLKLEFNPRKTILQPVARGIDHLGYFHRWPRVRVRARVVRAAKQRVDLAMNGHGVTSENIAAAVNSYLGHFRGADGFYHCKSLCQRLMTADWSDGRFVVDGHFSSLRPIKPAPNVPVNVGVALLDECHWTVDNGVWQSLQKPS